MAKVHRFAGGAPRVRQPKAWQKRLEPPEPPARPSRAELLEQLDAARAAGDRTRVSTLLGKLMLTPHEHPPRSKP